MQNSILDRLDKVDYVSNILYQTDIIITAIYIPSSADFTIFNSPGDEDSKTHLTFLPTSKIDQVTEQNVRQIGFRYNLDKLCMYQKIISKSSLPHVLLCNLIKVRRREESKVSFGIVISWAVEKG